MAEETLSEVMQFVEWLRSPNIQKTADGRRLLLVADELERLQELHKNLRTSVDEYPEHQALKADLADLRLRVHVDGMAGREREAVELVEKRAQVVEQRNAIQRLQGEILKARAAELHAERAESEQRALVHALTAEREAMQTAAGRLICQWETGGLKRGETRGALNRCAAQLAAVMEPLRESELGTDTESKP